MRVLVLDTALDACTVGVFDGVRQLAGQSEPMGRGHQEHIGVLVRACVQASGGFEAIERIGVTVGPGSFTGLRVGLAFALGLGAALDRPVMGLSTLQALAASVPGPDPVGPVASVIDARRGQVYLQTFLDGEPLDEPRPSEIAEARKALEASGRAWTLIGSGAGLVAPEGGYVLASPVPSASALARLTCDADPETARPRPLYLRAPDATPPTRLPGQARPQQARPQMAPLQSGRRQTTPT